MTVFQTLDPLNFIYNVQSISYSCVIPLSPSFIPRHGSDWGKRGPEAAGHGGAEEAKGERAGERRGAAEAVHSQEPDHWLRITVSFACLRLLWRVQNLFMYCMSLMSPFLLYLHFPLLASLILLSDFCRESWRVWETLNTSFRLFRTRWMRTPPRSSLLQCESLILRNERVLFHRCCYLQSPHINHIMSKRPLYRPVDIIYFHCSVDWT